MKKIVPILITIVVVCFTANQTYSQGTLQFNRALIVTNNVETVPAGKVWKVDAVYGKQSNVCLSLDPLYNGYYSVALVTGFYVNGVEILSSRKFLNTSLYGAGCFSNYGSGYTLTPLNFDSDPNILPVWLPAGTTTNTMGPNVFLSVLEFNIIP